jgi:hypothetical protein
MRPTVEIETLRPSRRSSTAILRLPHIGLSLHKSSTARASSLAQGRPRITRCGLRLKGSGFFSQLMGWTALPSTLRLSACNRKESFHDNRDPRH